MENISVSLRRCELGNIGKIETGGELSPPGRWRPLFLHAASLEIVHPVSGEKMKFEAKFPEELQKVV